MSQSYLHLSHLLPHLGLVLQLFLPEETRGANWFNVRSSFVKHWLYFEEMICKCELIAVLPDIFQLNQMLCLCCQQQPPHFIITCFHLKREVESEQKNELRGGEEEEEREEGGKEEKERNNLWLFHNENRILCLKRLVHWWFLHNTVRYLSMWQHKKNKLTQIEAH